MNNVTYDNKRECSVQETVSHMLPELHLQKIFLGISFVNTSLPEEQTRILLSKKESEYASRKQ